jgi:predicted MPP superfamily phosphohydrolase
LGLAVHGFWIEPDSFVIRRERIALAGWKGDLTVAALADLHVGSPYVGIEKLRYIVDRVNAERPDLVVLLGDFVVNPEKLEHGVLGGTFVEPADIGRELRRLKAPLGVYAVLGNHDGWYDSERVVDGLESHGIPVLRNRAVRLEHAGQSFWLGGLEDLWTGNPDVAATLRETNPEEPVVLIAHNPDSFSDMPARVNLFLAGHTHGDQVNLPVLGALARVSWRGYRDGVVRDGGRTMFITHGVGTSGLPVRVLAEPEAALLHLVAQ